MVQFKVVARATLHTYLVSKEQSTASRAPFTLVGTKVLFAAHRVLVRRHGVILRSLNLGCPVGGWWHRRVEGPICVVHVHPTLPITLSAVLPSRVLTGASAHRAHGGLIVHVFRKELEERLHEGM